MKPLFTRAVLDDAKLHFMQVAVEDIASRISNPHIGIDAVVHDMARNNPSLEAHLNDNVINARLISSDLSAWSNGQIRQLAAELLSEEQRFFAHPAEAQAYFDYGSMVNDNNKPFEGSAYAAPALGTLEII